LHRLQKIDPNLILSYRRSRRLKNTKRRSLRIFKFRSSARLSQNLATKSKQFNLTKMVRPLTNVTLTPSPLNWRAVRPTKLVGSESPFTALLTNNKTRKKRAASIVSLTLLKHSSKYSSKILKENKTVTNTPLRHAGTKLRKKKRALFHSKISGYKNPQTTRSYKLEYNKQFSTSFTKNCKNVPKNQSFLESYPFSNTEALVPTLSILFLQKTLTTSWFTYHSNFLRTKKPLVYTPELAKLSNSTYLQQMYNIFFLNTIGHTSKLVITNGLIRPDTESQYVTHSVAPINATLSWTKVQIVQNWSLESDFVRRKNLKAPNAVFVLGKAPTYRMSKNSESPISTSQQNGNFFNSWSRLPYSKSGTLALFPKSTISPFISKLNRSKPGIKPEQMFSTIYTLLNSNFTTQRKLSSRKLTYVRPTNFIATQNPAPLSTKGHSKSLMGMKQITVSVRKKTKGYSRVRSKSLRKQKLLSMNLILSRRRQLRLKRLLKRNIRRMGRFLRWKAKKATLFFTRCAKMSRNRKKHIKKLYHSTIVSSRTIKHNSFNTNVTPSSQYSLNVKDLLTNSNTNRLSTKSLALLSIGPNTISHTQTSLFLISNPLLLKSFVFPLKGTKNYQDVLHLAKQLLPNVHADQLQNTNLTPHQAFNKVFTKKVLNSFANRLFRDDIIPLYQNTLIRFIEFCTGKKAMFQFYPFVNQHIDKAYMVRYKRWLPRMGFYERRLGHRFFLEESLHIIHISFVLRDPKIIASWLRAMILRISFWKTRSIFRFLKYLFHNYFIHVFDDIKIKGLKIRLKGKISAAGNSRKRTILYRIGNTSHSEVNLRVVKDFSLINTFTGVMGFQVYLFY